MQTVQKLTVGKNALWTAYLDAGPVKQVEIRMELKRVGLFRHWYSTASKEHYNLHKPYGPLRDIFLKHLPETAPLFGIELQPANSQAA